VRREISFVQRRAPTLVRAAVAVGGPHAGNEPQLDVPAPAARAAQEVHPFGVDRDDRFEIG
jgi:hypothetical protein